MPNTLVEVSFGAIPRPIDKAIRAITGIDRFYGIAHIIGGKLYGTTMLAFKKETDEPSRDLLESYAHMVAVSLRRSNAEKSLRESEERYRRLIETTDTGYVIIDTNGTVLDANSEYLRLSGHKNLADILGRSVLEWTADEEKKKNENALISTMEIGFIRNFEITYIDKNGEHTPVEVNAAVIEMEGTQRILSLCRDITIRKQTEQSLHNAQKLESLGILAGGIAHDFNNLLAGIFGNIDLAYEKTKGKEVADDLRIALGTIDRARGLTHQLLTFAKGGSPVKRIDRLYPFIRETIQFTLSGSPISCTFKIPDNLWMCSFDKTQIGQVIVNIVLNAQQAMPDGGTIDISAENVTQGEKIHATLPADNYVAISITDHGIGMPKEILPRIFDPFYTTKPKGHGLGLATCYSIINRHGGFIEVESEPGKGSKFCFYLPASPDSTTDDTEQISSIHKGAGTILVMDDEDVVRENIGKILKSFGYSVVCTKNGNEAIGFLIKEFEANRNIAGAIFDLTIPGGIGGKKAIVEVRKIYLEIPVFVVSGYADDPVMVNPREYGFTASLCKPFRITELVEVLNKYLNAQE